MTTEYPHLSAEERGAIMAMKQQDCRTRLTGRTLRRAPSTITRELRRDGWRSPSQDVRIGRPFVAGEYNATEAGDECAAQPDGYAICAMAAPCGTAFGACSISCDRPSRSPLSSSETIQDNPACKPRTRLFTRPSMPGPRESFAGS